MLPLSDIGMTQSFTHEDEKRLFAWFEATRGRPWDSLSKAEIAVWHVYAFELQVANGGFHQALLNDGDRWQETLRALRRIDAVKIAQMFEESLTVFRTERQPQTIEKDTHKSPH
jgi:hypothetical protein